MLLSLKSLTISVTQGFVSAFDESELGQIFLELGIDLTSLNKARLY